MWKRDEEFVWGRRRDCGGERGREYGWGRESENGGRGRRMYGKRGEFKGRGRMYEREKGRVWKRDEEVV